MGKYTLEIASASLMAFLILGSCIGGCSRINKMFSLKDDNLIEEVLEEYIMEELDIDIDLTPQSQE